MAILGEDELREALAGRRQWRREGDSLVRERMLRDFPEALGFLERIGEAVDDWGRHPDVAIIGGNRVRVTVSNLNGAGFTEAELRMVAKVDEVADEPVVPRRPIAAAVASTAQAPAPAAAAAVAEEDDADDDSGSVRAKVAVAVAGSLAVGAAAFVAARRL